MNSIYLVAGDKGGVGKSMVATALVDFLLTHQEDQIVLVDADARNPSVARVYDDDESKTRVRSELLDLFSESGWSLLTSICAESVGSAVVIDTPAQLGTGAEQYRNFIGEAVGALRECGRQFVILWTIAPDDDSLELMDDCINIFPGCRFHIVKNLKEGAESDFVNFNQFERSKIEQAGGRIGNLPRLRKELAQRFRRDNRPCMRILLEESRLGEQIELKTWRQKTHAMFKELLYV